MLTLEGAADALAKMEWRTERRAGVKHYVAGQHRVIPLTDEEPDLVCLLAFVPTMGHSVVCVPICITEGQWDPVGLAFHILCNHPHVEQLSADFRLSPAMLKALNESGVT